MYSDADMLAILAELKDIRNELDRLKGFDVPRPSGDFVRIPGDTMTGALITPILQLSQSSVSFLAGIPRVYYTADSGFVLISGTGASNDLVVASRDGSDLLINPANSHNLILAGGGGNIVVGNVTPTAKFSVAEKCAMNADGGFMVKITNKTGGNSVKGHVLMAHDTVDFAVSKVVVDDPDAIGVFYESGIADGSEAWVVVAGIADVYFIGNTTHGYMARTFLTGDAGYVTGQALAEPVGTPPFVTEKHFSEIGHCIESRTGAGLAKTILHFN